MAHLPWHSRQRSDSNESGNGRPSLGVQTRTGTSLPKLEEEFTPSINKDSQAWKSFTQRLESNFDHLFQLYHTLYGTRYDMIFHLENLLRAWRKPLSSALPIYGNSTGSGRRTSSGFNPTR
jgi:predicted component of type VI protein secretion system